MENIQVKHARTGFRIIDTQNDTEFLIKFFYGGHKVVRPTKDSQFRSLGKFYPSWKAESVEEVINEVLKNFTLTTQLDTVFCQIFKGRIESYDGYKSLVSTADASCCPKDNFKKSVGRKISIDRALRKLGEADVEVIRKGMELSGIKFENPKPEYTKPSN